MSALPLDGKSLAKEMESILKERVSLLAESFKHVPKLATILVGDDPSSATYVKMKALACQRVGMASVRVELPHNTTTEELLQKIHELNQDPLVHGILLQHPVPSHINERMAFEAIDINKDVDGVTCLGFGRMAMGEAAYGSATPAGIISLLEHYKIPLEGKHAVVVGRSAILGKPMALMLLQKNCTVTICHSKTLHLEKFIAEADILVGAVGIPHFIKSKWIKTGAVVIDAGYHPGGIGDIENTKLSSIASAYTPVPGGVGPMTISTLIRQSIESGETQIKSLKTL